MPFGIHNGTRQLHAIMVKFCAKEWLGVCVWPAESPEKPCCSLYDPDKSWLDARAGDKVLLKRANHRNWEERIIESITLHRVFPVEFNGSVVETARTWLEATPCEPVA